METQMTDPETKSSKAVQDMAADITALREDLMKLSASVRDLVQTQATSTTKRVAGVVDDARHKLTDEMALAKDQLEGHLGTMTADLEATIERSPLLAVFVGAAVGFVIGLASRSSHKS
jgi:ElaB/YqjD/DUF883 family membrane-anchored ribosome-binding protein